MLRDASRLDVSSMEGLGGTVNCSPASPLACPLADAVTVLVMIRSVRSRLEPVRQPPGSSGSDAHLSLRGTESFKREDGKAVRASITSAV
jgi:hypothetical protein